AELVDRSIRVLDLFNLDLQPRLLSGLSSVAPEELPAVLDGMRNFETGSLRYFQWIAPKLDPSELGEVMTLIGRAGSKKELEDLMGVLSMRDGVQTMKIARALANMTDDAFHYAVTEGADALRRFAKGESIGAPAKYYDQIAPLYDLLFTGANVPPLAPTISRI